VNLWQIMGKKKRKALDPRATAGALLLAILVLDPARRLLPPVAAQLAATQQMTTSGAEDAGVLLEIKAAADTSACSRPGWMESGDCPLDSWDPTTEPCGDGHDDERSGWVGVVCDGPGGRVVWVSLGGTGVAGELLPLLGRLGALVLLNLSNNPALRGDVADFAALAQLRYLGLINSALGVGAAAALAALTLLGGEFTTTDTSLCDSGQCTGGLGLAGSGVHGPVAALRALPGLPADWGPDDDSMHVGQSIPNRPFDYSPCSAFGGQRADSSNDYTWGTGSPGCGAAGLAPVAVSPSTPALLPLLSLASLASASTCLHSNSRSGAGRGVRGWDRRVRLLHRQPQGAGRNHGRLRCPSASDGAVSQECFHVAAK
jgi:hypothetical protein